MTIIFDLDETLCETDRYSEEFIRSFFIENRIPVKQIATNTRFAEEKFNWSHQDALRWYKEYGDEMFLNFPCKEKAVEVLNSLYEAGHRIIIATARSTDWHAEPKKMTLAWLKNNGIKFHKIYFAVENKEKVCEIEDADIFIDDDIKTTSRVAKYFEQKGKGKSYLITSNYNKNLQIAPKVKRVESLSDFYYEIEPDTVYDL